MRHQRSEIRAAIKARMVNETPADDRVYINRSTPLWELEELPAILVFTPSWTDTLFNQSPPIWKQTVEIRVVVALELTDGDALDDEIDDEYSDSIERLLLNDQTLGGAVAGIRPIGGAQEFISDTQNKVAGLTLVFEADFTYQRPGKEVTAGLDNLKTVHNQYSLDGKQAQADQSADTITGLYPS